MQIIKTAAEERYTLGVIYPADKEDLQGHWASADTLQKACWDYMRDLQKSAAGFNDEHDNSGPIDSELGEIVELFVMPVTASIDGREIKKGSWMGGIVWTEKAWDMIKSGKRIGLSMEGKGWF